MKRSSKLVIAVTVLLAPPALFAGNIQLIQMEVQRKAQEATGLQRIVD